MARLVPLTKILLILTTIKIASLWRNMYKPEKSLLASLFLYSVSIAVVLQSGFVLCS